MSDDILETLKCGRPEYNEETRNYETVITKNERLAIKEITRLREELAAVTERMSKLDFERTAAELERDALREENARLREVLKQCEQALQAESTFHAYGRLLYLIDGDKANAACAAIREGGKDEGL